MDIEVAFSRLGIFVFVYAIVLGIPFLFGYRYGMWKSATWSMLLLATAGPFIYLFLQKKAENRILQEEIRIRDLLDGASHGITKVRELHKLLEVVIDILASSLRLVNAGIYLHEGERFVLKKSKSAYSNHVVIDWKDPLIERLMSEKSPLIFEEVRTLLEGRPDDEALREIIKQMQELSAQVIVPIIEQDSLLGFIILGERRDGGVYSRNLINALSLIGDQTGLAIEIAMFVEEKEKTLKGRFERRRFESLGTLVNSVSHQVNNHFHGIMQRSALAVEMFKSSALESMSREELIDLFNMIMKNVERVSEIATDGGKVADAVLNYSKGRMDFEVLRFEDIVERSINFTHYKHPKFQFECIKEYDDTVQVWGASAPLQDVIFNAMDNSCLAMKIKKEKNNELNPRILIRGKVDGKMFRFEIEDNGIGIKKEDLEKVMDPMYTSRGIEGGTGMGTTVMQQFILKHGGEIAYDSSWGEWTRVKISLPLPTKKQMQEGGSNEMERKES